MIIEPKLIDHYRDEVAINKDNVVLNGQDMFLHYQRNAEGYFDIVYTKNNIGAKAYYNNQIWVLLNPNKDTIYHAINHCELELDSIIDIYKIKSSKKDNNYLCVVTEVPNQNEIIDTLGVVINPQTLEPIFVYSVNNNETKSVMSQVEAKRKFGCTLSTNYRLQHTIEQLINNDNIISKNAKERCEILERVIKKA